jgi:hypothetical protein
MACKAYNPNACLRQCQTYEEALKIGHQCCIYCYNGKHQYGCSDCHLEETKVEVKDLENKNDSKLIVFCLTGNTFSGNFLDSFIELTSYCFAKNIKFLISRRESPVVYYVRNMCLGGDTLMGVNQKPYNGKLDYTHLMWIDNDIIFTPQQFQKLLDHDKDIVSGIYMMSDKKHFATVENWDEEYFKRNGSFEFFSEESIKKRSGLIDVSYTGLGFMLVKKGVFESLEYPWFQPIFHNIGNARDFSSEDVSFCKLIRDKGYQIFIDPKIRVGHEKKVIL